MFSMDDVEFQQVEDEEQKQAAGSLIREYLEWLNDRLKREYGIEFEGIPFAGVRTVIESVLASSEPIPLPVTNPKAKVPF